jgi:hypothetical protein
MLGALAVFLLSTVAVAVALRFVFNEYVPDIVFALPLHHCWILWMVTYA